MNGVHDMGGDQDMGPIQYEKNEPVFHAAWEGRVYAMYRAVAAWGRWSLDAFRHEQELVVPSEYLRMSYYERWLAALTALISKSGLATPAEIESGKPAPGASRAAPPLTVAEAALTPTRSSARRPVAVAARFAVGHQVRTRNINPVGHTRLPRYARGRSGTIDLDHGVFLFPDTSAHFLGEKPQHLYSVRFAARELWGEQAAAQDAVYIDLFEDYLEPA